MRSWSRRISLALLALALSACHDPATDFGFEVRRVDLLPGALALDVSIAQDLRLSWESRNALQHGVPLAIAMNMELRDRSALTLLASQSRLFEIRYLPLSERYELSDLKDGTVRTFPRLRHAINALASLRLEFESGPLAPGDYEFRTRVRLDQSRLPAPMQLPVLISGKWRHDSDWTSWPFTISA